VSVVEQGQGERVSVEQGQVSVEQGRGEQVSVEQGQVSVGPVSVDGREQGWVVEQVEDSSFR